MILLPQAYGMSAYCPGTSTVLWVCSHHGPMDTNRHRPPEAIYATVAGRQREALKNLVAARKANKAIAAICEDYVSQKKIWMWCEVGVKGIFIWWCDVMWYDVIQGYYRNATNHILLPFDWWILTKRRILVRKMMKATQFLLWLRPLSSFFYLRTSPLP